jgi:hypothetical protein
VELYNTTQTNELTLVTNKSEPEPKAPSFGPWIKMSSQPVVRNKELDDWVPASEDTRITALAEEEEEGLSICGVP